MASKTIGYIKEARSELLKEIKHHLAWCEKQKPGSSLESASEIRALIHEHFADHMSTTA